MEMPIYIKGLRSFRCASPQISPYDGQQCKVAKDGNDQGRADTELKQETWYGGTLSRFAATMLNVLAESIEHTNV